MKLGYKKGQVVHDKTNKKMIISWYFCFLSHMLEHSVEIKDQSDRTNGKKNLSSQKIIAP